MNTDPDKAGIWEPFGVPDQAAGQWVVAEWSPSPKLGERRIFPCTWDGDHTWTAVADGVIPPGAARFPSPEAAEQALRAKRQWRPAGSGPR